MHRISYESSLHEAASALSNQMIVFTGYDMYANILTNLSLEAVIEILMLAAREFHLFIRLLWEVMSIDTRLFPFYLV